MEKLEVLFKVFIVEYYIAIFKRMETQMKNIQELL